MMNSVMKCEKNVITIILLQLNYLIYSLSNYVNDTPTKTGLLESYPRLSAKPTQSLAPSHAPPPLQHHAAAIAPSCTTPPPPT